MGKHEAIYDKSRNRKLNIKKVILIVFILFFAIIVWRFNLIYKAYLFIKPIKIESIEISLETDEFEPEETANISTKITPENFTKSNLIWHSTDENVIEIVDGKIIAKQIGKASIYLTDDSGETEISSNKIDLECLIKIKDVEITNQIDSLKLGDIYKLETKVLPEEATYKELTYESSNIEIASIDNNGNIIANAIGNVTITVKDYKENILKSFSLDIKKIPVEKITLDDTEINLGKGQEYIINSKVTPVEATYNDVEWKSSDENIITIKNRKIKAISEGKAKIIATTDEGEKEATLIVNVTKDAPSNTKLYANGRYNIRNGASTDYSILATTSQYEQIEFLQDTKNGWKKVRNEKGIVGYTLVKSDYYIKEKPVEPTSVSSEEPESLVTSYHIDKVPYLNQISLGYPTGCEAVSATMVLKYKGFDVSTKNIIDNMKIGSKKYKGEDGNWYGGNPFEEFVGNPSLGLSKGSYGVFAKPIANAMSVYAGGRVKNISGCSEKSLLNYVSKGNPVVVWCVKNAGNLSEGVIWTYENRSGNFQELIGEHCAVLIGFDEDYVYLNDPSAGSNVKQSRNKFMSNWKRLYSQAIVVE